MRLTEAILGAKKLITHANCMDGLATAMIVRDALPDIPIEFVQYNTPEYLALKPEPGVIFCDVVPAQGKPDEVSAWAAAGAVMLDHHKENRDIVEACGALGVFADEKTEPGVSGAVLAQRHVWTAVLGTEPSERERLVHEFARLVGTRDTWQKTIVIGPEGRVPNKEWLPALALHEVLAAFPAAYWLGHPNFEGKGPVVGAGIEAAMEQLLLGRLILEEKIHRVRHHTAHGLLWQEATHGRLWALAAAPYQLVSDLAEAARGESAAANVFVNVHNAIQNGQLLHVVSLRSDGSVDVGALAKRHGGGGHSRAAGFSEPQLLSVAQLFRLLILEAEQQLDATSN